jgi:hypothetical protein
MKEVYFVYDINGKLKETVYYNGEVYYSSSLKKYKSFADFASSRTLDKNTDGTAVYSAIEKI